MRMFFTTCRICLATCGLAVAVGDEGRIERIAPDKNAYSWGDFGPMGQRADELVAHPPRLRSHMKRSGTAPWPLRGTRRIAERAA